MKRKLSKKQRDKVTLARVVKEMARPRVAESAAHAMAASRSRAATPPVKAA